MPMLYHAKNGTAAGADYIRFGTGKKTLIMLPGLGDGLRTTRGTALPMALYYRCFAKDYTVYMISRKTVLSQGATTRDMARDLKQAMDILGIEKAHLFGVSMGGMIAQHFAADYPDRLHKLVLAVTCPRPNPILEESVQEWVSLARQGNAAGFMESNVRRIYSDAYYRKNKWLTPIVGALTKPKSYDRFFIQARACLTHDAFGRLGQISAPTLVIGGAKDKALGVQASLDIAFAIPGAKLKVYPDWGHGVYEEAPDFNETVLNFLLS